MAEITQREQVILQMETDATRKYPFSRRTLDQIQDLRLLEERTLKKECPEKDFLVPAPIIIARAVERLHFETFLP